MNIPQTKGGVNRQAIAHSPRTPVRTYHPQNAPHITAFVLYLQSDGSTVARSEGSIKRILRTPPAIASDAGVIADLERDHVDIIEVHIKDTNTTYTTTPEIMRKYGQIQRRFGVQLILSLKFWGINGQEPAAFKQAKAEVQQQPEAQQASLFDMPPVRKGGAY